MRDSAAGGATRDAFLGGRLTIRQPRRGYRAGVDPVLLAASVDARPGQSVLDLGCGVGAAALCLGRRVGGLTLTGLEIQPECARLARLNAKENGIAMTVVEGDLADMPAPLRQERFDHVIANPPYLDRRAGTPAADSRREAAIGEGAALEVWVRQAAKRCAPKGRASFIVRADRLPDLLCAARRHLGSLDLLPLVPRRGAAASLAVLRGRKGGRGAFRLRDAVAMHAGARGAGADRYSAAIERVLRGGAALVPAD